MTANRTYTLARGGQRYGPYTLEQLRDYVLRRHGAAHAGTGQRDRASRPFTRADASEPRPRDGEQRQERHGDHRELRARECDHPSSVALDL